MMSDVQVDTLCAGLSLGTQLRIKMAVKQLRETNNAAAASVAEPGSGLVDVASGQELPRSTMRGTAMGGSEVLMAEDKGVAFVMLAGRGWVQVRKMPSQPLASPQEAYTAFSGKVQHPGASDPASTGSGFGRPGPLQELTAGCRELLNQVGGRRPSMRAWGRVWGSRRWLARHSSRRALRKARLRRCASLRPSPYRGRQAAAFCPARGRGVRRNPFRFRCRACRQLRSRKSGRTARA